MKLVFFAFLLSIGCTLVTAQKKPLDLAALDSWPQIEKEKISNNGKYVIYNISSKKEGIKLVAQATDSSWKTEIKGATSAIITEDSKRVIFKSKNDSIGIIELENGNLYLLDMIASYKVPPEGNGEWIAYQLKDQAKDLVILNLYNGQRNVYLHVDKFIFSSRGECLVIQQRIINNNLEIDSLIRLNLSTGVSHLIWIGRQAFSLVIDKTGSQISFVGDSTEKGQKKNILWYCKANIGEDGKVLINDSTSGMQGLAVSQNQISFTDDGENLFFYVHPFIQPGPENGKTDGNHLIVWGYLDKVLSESPAVVRYSANFAAAINLQFQQKVIRISNEKSEYIYGYNNNRVLVFSNNIGTPAEYKWRLSARPNLYLVSTIDGTRQLLKKCLINFINGTVGFSPSGSYAFWFDRVIGHWFSYNVRTGITKNITKKIPVPLTNRYAVTAEYPPATGMAGWIRDESAFLIYDDYDIWKVDPDGISPPINVTLGYGRKHHILMRHVELNKEQSIISYHDTLLLYTFNTVTKDNGFAKLVLNVPGRLIIFPMHPVRFYFNNDRYSISGLETDPRGSFALKAKDANVFVFKPARPDKFPNISVTGDFIYFKPLTAYAPQKQFNWYSNELLQWKREDGVVNEGILFKPEDFNPDKKYPLIVYIYEQFADALNVFLKPGLTGGALNIPWYVSHGYLVLIPDIRYTLGYPGESAFKSVISAVHYLSHMRWLDLKKLGLQGASYGGYETNYIMTRTNLFAAAAPSFGTSDLISASGQIFNGTGWQWFYEISQARMGATLWERPDLYIHNSPIFKVNKIVTPLLIMHNTLDNTVPFPQSIEWFTALRRLGKKAWMLQYTNESHGLSKEENQLDYSIRLDQFFDHFLKGAPAPQWMTGE